MQILSKLSQFILKAFYSLALHPSLSMIPPSLSPCVCMCLLIYLDRTKRTLRYKSCRIKFYNLQLLQKRQKNTLMIPKKIQSYNVCNAEIIPKPPTTLHNGNFLHLGGSQDPKMNHQLQN